MPKVKSWTYSEEQVLLENYTTKTIKELMVMLPGRLEDSINCKIKRLKASKKLSEGKDEETVQRAYLQRGEQVKK
jgi:hypothetical protein